VRKPSFRGCVETVTLFPDVKTLSSFEGDFSFLRRRTTPRKGKKGGEGRDLAGSAKAKVESIGKKRGETKEFAPR